MILIRVSQSINKWKRDRVTCTWLVTCSLKPVHLLITISTKITPFLGAKSNDLLFTVWLKKKKKKNWLMRHTRCKWSWNGLDWLVLTLTHLGWSGLDPRSRCSIRVEIWSARLDYSTLSMHVHYRRFFYRSLLSTSETRIDSELICWIFETLETWMRYTSTEYVRACVQWIVCGGRWDGF